MGVTRLAVVRRKVSLALVLFSTTPRFSTVCAQKLPVAFIPRHHTAHNLYRGTVSTWSETRFAIGTKSFRTASSFCFGRVMPITGGMSASTVPAKDGESRPTHHHRFGARKSHQSKQTSNDNECRSISSDKPPNESGNDEVSTTQPKKARRGGNKGRKFKNNKHQQTSESKDPTKKKRQNRPGFNSYLKVLLDDGTMDRLYKMALEVQTQLARHQQQQEEQRDRQNCVNQFGGVEANGNSTVVDSVNSQDATMEGEDRTPRRSALKFKPRSRESLHMTLFFGGETLCELPSHELQEWHSRVSSRLKQSGFILLEDGEPHGDTIMNNTADATTTSNTSTAVSETMDADNMIEDENNCNDPFAFRVVGLDVFPPQRNNLIVALLEPATPAWDTLHGDLRQIAKDETLSPGLAEITKYSKDRWISHITLGNLIGRGNNIKKQVRQCGLLMDRGVSSEGGDKSNSKNGSEMKENLLHRIFHDQASTTSSTTQSLNSAATASAVVGATRTNASNYIDETTRDNCDEGTSGITTNEISMDGGWIAYPNGISMGGPIPQQVSLPWNFTYTK